MGTQKVYTELHGLADLWEGYKVLRSRVKALGCILVEFPTEGGAEVPLEGYIPRTMLNARYNSDALMPVMQKMSGAFDKVPELASLCHEFKKLALSEHRNPTKDHIMDQAWSVRYLFGVTKHLLYKPAPPRAAWPCVAEVVSYFSISFRFLGAWTWSLSGYCLLGVATRICGGH